MAGTNKNTEVEELPTPEELNELPTPEELDELPTPEDLKKSDDEEIMGVMETLGLKIGEGASLGLSDILTGAAGAVGSLLPENLPDEVTESLEKQGFDMSDEDVDKVLKEQGFKLPEESLLEAYKSSKAYSKRLQEKAAKDRPYLSTAADIGGGIASGSAIGKLAQGTGRLAKAAKLLPGGTELKSGQSLLKSTGQLLKEGAKAGAVTGFAKGDSSLLEGDLAGTIQDTGMGATVGAGGSVVLGKGAKAIGSGLKGGLKGLGYVSKAILGGDKFDVGREAGKRGIDLFDEKQVQEELTKAADSIRKEINKVFKGSDKFKMNKLLDEAGVKIQAGTPVREALDELVEQGVVDPSNRKAVNEFSDFLDTLLTKKTKKFKKIEQSIEKSAAQKLNKIKRQGGEVETRTEFDTPIDEIAILPEHKGSVKGVQDRISFRTEDGDKIFEDIITQKARLEELVPDKLPDLDNLSASELDVVIDNLNKYTKDDANPAVIGVARKLSKSLKQLRNSLGEELDDLDVAKQYSNLSKGMSIKERIGSRLFKSGEASQDALMTELKSIASAKEGSKLDKLNFIKQQLSELADDEGPEAVKRIEESTEFVQLMNKLRKSDLDPSIKSATPTTGFGLIPSTQTKFAQAVGRAEAKLGKEIIDGKQILNKLADNKYVDKLYTRLSRLKGPIRDEYNRVLESLSLPETPDRKKNALIMGLMQDPAFRQMLRDAEDMEDINEQSDREQD